MLVANTTGGLMLQTMLYLANQTSRAAVNTLVDFPPLLKNDVDISKCFGVYGCFPINGPWVSFTRQLNVFPQKPSEIAPHFTLYTKRAFNQSRFLDLNDPDAVSSLGINPKGKIYFVAHGYLEMGAMPWMLQMGKTLLQKEPEGEACVILIDWGGGSNPPYVQAVANIRLVGAMTAHVIHMLYEELNLKDLKNVHLIGHSLGAHLAGYAGYYLQKDFGLKVERITGLDPAAPLFTETDPIVRLDRSDATFVDIIHTDSNPLMKGGLGILQRLGHVDFYPNGGFDNPGCDVKFQDYMRKREDTFLATMQQVLGCNHVRSYYYFTESIKSKCPFMGIQCSSYQDFKDGKCAQCDEDKHLCLRMGYNTYEDYKKLEASKAIKPNKPPMLYLMTGGSEPFCRLHYKITIRVSGHDESTIHGGEIGRLSIRLYNNKKQSTERLKFSEKAMYFEPGNEYKALVPGSQLDKPTYATVFWEYQTNILNPLTWRLLSTPRIYLEYILIESLESYPTYLKLCPTDDGAIVQGIENKILSENCAN